MLFTLNTAFGYTVWTIYELFMPWNRLLLNEIPTKMNVTQFTCEVFMHLLANFFFRHQTPKQWLSSFCYFLLPMISFGELYESYKRILYAHIKWIVPVLNIHMCWIMLPNGNYSFFFVCLFFLDSPQHKINYQLTIIQCNSDKFFMFSLLSDGDSGVYSIFICFLRSRHKRHRSKRNKLQTVV